MKRGIEKLFNRLACVFSFITDIPILVFTFLMIIIGTIGVIIFRKVTFAEYWDSISGALKRLKRLYANLWKSFRDGELYPVPRGPVV